MITIRYTPKDTHELITRDVEFKSERLDFGTREGLKLSCNPLQFFEYDLENSDEQGKPRIKAMDLASLQASMSTARVQLVRVCFGIGDIHTDTIVADDMQELLDIVIEKDPARIEKDKKEADDSAKKGVNLDSITSV